MLTTLLRGSILSQSMITRRIMGRKLATMYIVAIRDYTTSSSPVCYTVRIDAATIKIKVFADGQVSAVLTVMAYGRETKATSNTLAGTLALVKNAKYRSK